MHIVSLLILNTMEHIYGVWTILMLKILQAHLLRAFFAYLKIYATRLCAALRAADLVITTNHNNFGRGRGGRAGINKNVTYVGSQLTRRGGAGGI